MHREGCHRRILATEADLGFSRGESGFSKKLRNFNDLFFRSTKLISAPQPKLKKKTGQKRRFQNVDQSCVFLGARSPSKLAYIGAKGAFRKILGSISLNGYLKVVQRGKPLGGQGVESLREETSAPSAPSPISAPDCPIALFSLNLLTIWFYWLFSTQPLDFC